MKVKLKDINHVDDFHKKNIKRVSHPKKITDKKEDLHSREIFIFIDKDKDKDKEYEVIEICETHYRIINEHGEPILYDKRMFDIIDPSIPKDYIYEFYFYDDEKTTTSEDGEVERDFEECYNILPKCFSYKYFFESYFDGHEEQVKIYNEYIQNNEAFSFKP